MTQEDALTQHVESALYGAPKIKPDEQRRYLGTFRERVSLAMTISQVTSGAYLAAFNDELLAHPDEQVIFNGHLPQADLGPYMRMATQHHVALTIKDDQIAGLNDSDYGIIVASDHAINVDPIDVAAKYPTTTTSKTSDPTPSFWDRFKRSL